MTSLEAADCEANIASERPRVYVATFLVPGGKRSLGTQISDNIAMKFMNDGRFDVVPRSTVSRQMSNVTAGKMSTQAYLNLAIELANENNAD